MRPAGSARATGLTRATPLDDIKTLPHGTPRRARSKMAHSRGGDRGVCQADHRTNQQRTDQREGSCHRVLQYVAIGCGLAKVCRGLLQVSDCGS